MPSDRATRLRAHHLLCLLGFRGLGYDDAFVANMRRVADAYLSPDGCQVEITDGPDDICGACPKLKGNACKGEADAEARIREKDAAVLAALGLSAGARLDSRDTVRAAAENVDADRLKDICGGCQWLPLGYCEEGLRQGRPKDSK